MNEHWSTYAICICCLCRPDRSGLDSEAAMFLFFDDDDDDDVESRAKPMKS